VLSLTVVKVSNLVVIVWQLPWILKMLRGRHSGYELYSSKKKLNMVRESSKHVRIP